MNPVKGVFVKIVCPQCQYAKELDDAQVPPELVYATCPQCRNRFRFRDHEQAFSLEDDAAGPIPVDVPEELQGAAGDFHAAIYGDEFAPSPVPAGTGQTPWQARKSLGLLSAFMLTVHGVMLTPASFFGRIGTDWKASGVLLFYAISAVFGLTLNNIWAWAITTYLGDTLSATALLAAGGVFPGWSTAVTMIVTFGVLSPLVLLFTAAVLHGCLRIVGVGKGRFGTTVMVCGFATAADVLYLVPFIGHIMVGLWGLYILLVGMKHAHGTSMVRVLLAMLLAVAVGLVLLMAVGPVLLAWIMHG